MSGWTVPIRQASFKGVNFDVIAVDESFEKSIAEHSYPFLNGADLEDLGLEPQTVKLQAVCFGEGYYIEYKKLLAAIQQRGADVLMHPVRGRMPNMILVSANLRHDAENINYVALDLTFRENVPMKPIFVFEHSLLAKIDRYLNLADQYVADLVEWWASIMEIVAFAYNAKSRILSQWGAVWGCFEQLLQLFELDLLRGDFGLSMGVSKLSFAAQSERALRAFVTIIGERAQSRTFNSTLGIKSEFNELERDVVQVLGIPRLLVTGQAQRPNSAAQFFAMRDKRGEAKVKIAPDDVKQLNCLLHLVCCGAMAKTAGRVIEEQAENLTPAEIEYVAQQTRAMIVKSLALLRELQREEQAKAEIGEPNNGAYTANHKLSESLRNIAGELMQMAVAAINQKPPLMVKEVQFDGTLQQVSHAFYNDFSRVDELLRLNPQIRHPNFIEAGTLLNAYAQ